LRKEKKRVVIEGLLDASNLGTWNEETTILVISLTY